VTTPDGRTLYGGRGIEPDIRVSAADPNPLRSRLNESAFFYVRQLVAGKVAGLESFRAEKQSFRQTVAAGDFLVTERLFEAFRAYAVADKANGLTAENINSQAEYARARIRQELATANYSNEAGFQVFLETDPQILKALESMPQAGKLTETARMGSPVGRRADGN
jgi:carboxyl-terminal processing protease